MIRFILIGTLFISTSSLSSEKAALMKIKSLGMQLKKELKKGLAVSPVDAIKTCNIKAPVISKNLSKGEISVGRVSIKNRNPKNVPKEWMKSYISKFHEGKISSSHALVKISNSKMGVLKPIKTGALCLNCHGTNLSPLIEKKISELYPNDKATGYKKGQIRGFFWAEFPAK